MEPTHTGEGRVISESNNPPSPGSDEAIALGKTYAIRTIKDFLAVPQEKRVAMLLDFLNWLWICDDVSANFTHDELRIGDEFRWIDDGKTGLVEIVMRPMEGEE